MSVQFDRIAIIGIGLIGSSIARGLKQKNLAREIAIHDRSAEAMADAKALDLGHRYCASAGEAVARQKVLVNIDKTSPLRTSQGNPDILRLYDEFYGEPNSELAHHLLHTEYAPFRR